MNHRKVEVYRQTPDGDDKWVDTPFEELQVGDVFRLWEPVIDKDEKFGEVIAWRCKSTPEAREGVYGCMTEPAMTVPKEVEPAAAESSEPPPEPPPTYDGPPISPYRNRFG